MQVRGPQRGYAEQLAAFPELLKEHLRKPRDYQGQHEPNELLTAMHRDVHRDIEAATAFSSAWLTFQERQSIEALEGRRRFLQRYEWPSVWETQEVQAELCSAHRYAKRGMRKLGGEIAPAKNEVAGTSQAFALRLARAPFDE